MLQQRSRRKEILAQICLDDTLPSEEDDETCVYLSSDLFADVESRLEKTNEASVYVALATDSGGDWLCFPAQKKVNTLLHSTVFISNSSDNCQEQWLRHKTPVHVHAYRPISLDTIIVAVPEYKYSDISADPHKWFRGLVGRLLKSNATLPLGNISCRVLETHPLDCGILNKSTKITVIHDSVPLKNGVISKAISDEEPGVQLFRKPPDGFFYSLDGLPQEKFDSVFFRVRSIHRPVKTTPLLPLPPPAEDPENRVYANLHGLAQIGCFSGDLIALRTSSSGPSRLVRVYSLPQLAHESTHGFNELHMSPTLAANIGCKTVIASPVLESISVAKEIHVYKINSPSSLNRGLQGAFLSGLRHYFSEVHRVIVENDVVAISVDEISSQFLSEEDFDIYSPTARPTTVIWCRIRIPDGPRQARVDIATTKVVQVKSETSKVPSSNFGWRSYLQLPPNPKAPLNKSYRLLEQLLTATMSDKATELKLHNTILLHSSRIGVGKASLVREICGILGIHVLECSSWEIMGETTAKTEATLALRFEKAESCHPCIFLLTNLDAFLGSTNSLEDDAWLRDVLSRTMRTCTLVATTNKREAIGQSVAGLFRHEIEIRAPDQSERVEILKNLLEAHKLRDVDIHALSIKSAALVANDLADVVRRACESAMEEGSLIARAAGVEQFDVDLSGGIRLRDQHFETALSIARKGYSDSIGVPRIPNVTWEDVGGLGNVKADVIDTIRLPMDHPELFSLGVKKRSGILLYGPPGTGKTLVAKAIATEFSLSFFSVKGPELLNMYIGESEANVRHVFERARDSRPCVVFFDELDSVAPKRGNQGDSGGVMDRIVSQLLAELDGISEDSQGVYVVGATNRPDLLDPALLRPGRFDKALFLGPATSREEQLPVLLALTRKFAMAPDVVLQQVLDFLPVNLTGADLYALSSDAMLSAMTRRAEQVSVQTASAGISISQFFDENQRNGMPEVQVVVGMNDFIKAAKALQPSVSSSELSTYEDIRLHFANG